MMAQWRALMLSVEGNSSTTGEIETALWTLQALPQAEGARMCCYATADRTPLINIRLLAAEYKLITA